MIARNNLLTIPKETEIQAHGRPGGLGDTELMDISGDSSDDYKIWDPLLYKNENQYPTRQDTYIPSQQLSKRPLGSQASNDLGYPRSQPQGLPGIGQRQLTNPFETLGYHTQESLPQRNNFGQANPFQYLPQTPQYSGRGMSPQTNPLQHSTLPKPLQLNKNTSYNEGSANHRPGNNPYL